MSAWVLAAVVTAFAAPVVAERPQGGASSLTVVGRVVDPDGEPLAGAIVLADSGGSYQVMKEWIEIPWRHWIPDPVAAASIGPYTRRANSPTGADGRFRVEGVSPPAGEGWIVVIHPDFATARVDAKGGAKDGILDVGDVALQPGAAVRATVRTPDGQPASGAWVVVRSATPTSPARSPSSWAAGDEPGDVRVGRTGDDGTCTVRGVTPGRLRVASFTAAHVPTVVEANGVAATVVDAAITLVPGASLRVEVRSRGADAPVAGARVTVESPDAGMSWPGPAPLARVRTDQAGVAAIDGLEVLEEFRVTVVPPDFADDTVNHPGAFHVTRAAKPGTTVRVPLTPPRSLTVRVLDVHTKAPLVDAKVTVRPEWDQFDHSGGQAIDLSPSWDASEKAYVTPHARPGPWIVTAWAPGHHPVDGLHVRVEDGASPSIAVVEIPQGTASAFGRVVEKATGRPVAGALVSSYEWIQRVSDGNRATATSAADGTFHLAGLLGRTFPLRIEVHAAGYVTETRTWTEGGTWPEGERQLGLGDVALVRAATVRGRVTDSEGRPLARVGVVLHSFEFRGHGKGDGWHATTDDAGHFSFSDLPPGRYLLDGQRQSSPLTLAEGDTAVRDLVR